MKHFIVQETAVIKYMYFTDQPLVVVITATAYGATYAHSQNDKMMTDYILPAVVE